MAKVQFIYDDTGKRVFAVVPADKFDAMAEAEEELADIEAYRAGKARIAAGEPVIPAEIVNRVCEGENPVRVWRQHRGLKARELAVRANISHSYLSAIENGKQDGSLRVLVKLAEALGVDVDDLVPVGR